MEIQRVRVNRNLWKTNFSREITNLEDVVDQIYIAAGLKPHRVVCEDENDEGALTTKDKRVMGEMQGDFEHAIDEMVGEVRQSVNHICALISSVTEFDIPIPVLVLLRIAGRVCSIRCSEFTRKVPGSMAKRYIHTKKSLDLIESSLLMYKWISIILGTNILPFQGHINQNMISLLEWTRASNLCKHDESRYYSIRSQVIENITEALEQLSLNLNLDSRQLEALMDVELIQTLEESLASPATMTSMNQQKHAAATVAANGDLQSLKDKYTGDALVCLDRLFSVYADYLGAKLESRLKSFIIQTCIKIYRDFERSNVIGLANRRLHLRLLETISNRPYATSTSELAWHIFELAERLESDPEIRYLCRRAVKFGLAHRPIVVSHFDVFDCQASAMRSGHSGESVAPAVEGAAASEEGNTSTESIEPALACESAVIEGAHHSPIEGLVRANAAPAAECVAPPPSASDAPATTSSAPPTTSIAPSSPEPVEIIDRPGSTAPAPASSASIVVPSAANSAPPGPTEPPETSTTASTRSVAAAAGADQGVPADEENNGLVDETVQSCLDLFVDKPATTLPEQSRSADTNSQPLLNKPLS